MLLDHRRSPVPPTFGVALDPGVRRLEGGRVLLLSSPARLFRLSDRGRDVLDRLLAGETVGDVAARNPAAGGLARRLIDAGVLHPRPPAGIIRLEDVAVVIPVWNRPEGLRRTLAALTGLSIVVVDDGSTDDSAEVASRAGALVVRRERRAGPAAARNAGLRAVDKALVVFVDSDCVPEPGWLAPLLTHFADPMVGAVAPRIGGRRLSTGSALSRYESVRAPLDLGAQEGPVVPGTRLSYVPGAALAVRRDVFVELGGFEEDLRYGEDVDLVWRLVDAGWTVRYEPTSRVHHEHRSRLVPFLAQRASYGSSAAPLARRHPGRLAPLRTPRWSTAAWALAAAGATIPAALATIPAALSGVALARRLPLQHPWRESARLIGDAHLAAGPALASALVRAWLPLALLAAPCSRRFSRVLLASAVLPALVDWRRRRPALDPVRYLALRVVDDAAYCAGVWAGSLRERVTGPLVPNLVPTMRQAPALHFSCRVRSQGAGRRG